MSEKQKVKLSFDATELKKTVEKSETTAISEVFCRKDRQDLITKNRSQLQAFFEDYKKDFCLKVMKLFNNSEKMTIRDFKRALSVIVDKIEL